MTDTTTTTTAETPAPETEAAPEAATATASASTAAPERFTSFEDFYPFYIGEHQNQIARRLHIVGTGLAILCLTQVAMWGVVGGFGWLVMALICGYGFAWVAHYAFEKNQPATFKYPLWSLMGDFRMFYETVTGRRAF